MDLTKFTNLESKFNIIDGNNGEIIYSFTSGKGVNELEVPTNKITSYGISKDGNLLCIISIVDNLKNVDMESIKKKYIQ
jgi:plastocyanin domain-containing protein